MKHSNSIHDLNSLEKEIYRLQLEANVLAKQLEKDLDHLRSNFFSLAKNSFKKEKKEEGSPSFFDKLMKNEHIKGAVSGIADRITGHAAEAINGLIDRLFKKHK